MASKIEAIKNYVVSVADRTVGRNIYRSVTESWGSRFDGVSLAFIGVLQSPALMNSYLEIVYGSTQLDRPWPITWARYLSPGIIDFVSLAFVITHSHNVIELAAWRLATNAATHVALDLGSAAINRLKTFRPSATTLAV